MFTVMPDNPGPVRRWFLRCTLVFIVPLAVIAFVSFFAMSGWRTYAACRVYFEGVPVTATCTRSGSNGPTRFLKDRSDYQFQIGREIYRGQGGYKSKRGEKFEVLYLESNPSVHRPADEVLPDMAGGGFAVAAMVAVALLGVRRRPSHVTGL